MMYNITSRCRSWALPRSQFTTPWRSRSIHNDNTSEYSGASIRINRYVVDQYCTVPHNFGPHGGVAFQGYPLPSSRPGSSFSRCAPAATNSKVYAEHYAARAAAYRGYHIGKSSRTTAQHVTPWCAPSGCLLRHAVAHGDEPSITAPIPGVYFLLVRRVTYLLFFIIYGRLAPQTTHLRISFSFL
jgi:hypothetical protein